MGHGRPKVSGELWPLCPAAAAASAAACIPTHAAQSHLAADQLQAGHQQVGLEAAAAVENEVFGGEVPHGHTLLVRTLQCCEAAQQGRVRVQ